MIIKKASILVLPLIFIVSLFALSIQSPTLSAQNSRDLCSGANLDFGGTSPSCKSDDGKAAGAGNSCKNSNGDVVACSENSLNNLVAQIINVLSIVVGVVAVIMIIYSGFRYITSGGDSGKVSESKNTLVYAVIGLIIVALAQFIVKFILEKATK